MGKLVYAGGHEYVFDDHLLLHLKVVIQSKLMRGESFPLRWTRSVDEGSGRVSLWISPNVPLVFLFGAEQRTPLSKPWIEVLAELANSPQGLEVLSEQDALERSRRRQAALAQATGAIPIVGRVE